MGIFSKDTNQDWKKIGDLDPYFGVLTSEVYKNASLTEETKLQFFLSGEKYVQEVVRIIQEKIVNNFHPHEAIDFGCGVGRILIPLSKFCDKIYGVDLSDGMIKETVRNCDQMGITNFDIVKSDGDSVGVDHPVDFIHSFIVFQHIPVKRGMHLFKELLDHLRDGGVGVIHFTYLRRGLAVNKFFYNLFTGSKIVSSLWNAIKHRPVSYPVFEMNMYDSNELLRYLQEFGCHNLYIKFTNHGEKYLGVLLFFQKTSGLLNGISSHQFLEDEE
jgi:SAM-dependent methyltransferase